MEDGGIFPRTETQEVRKGAVENTCDAAEPPPNYASVEAEPEACAAELDRLEEKGYGTRFLSWKAARRALGPGITSRLAAIFKLREDGTRKTRLVLDQRRSGYNALVQLDERVVPGPPLV